eukprot:scaffold607246_cov29-Prasinocladus_malaysianus.AAC.1
MTKICSHEEKWTNAGPTVLLASPAGPSNAVNVRVDVLWGVHVDNCFDALDVQAPGCHIRGHEDVQLA